IGINQASFAQTGTIGGTVVDANKTPLLGVSVIVQGTSKGTATDLDGQYSLSNVTPGSILVFSIIGFVSQEVTVDESTTIDVLLEEDLVALAEIVVIGYGSMEKNKITSAITKVKPEDFNKGNINNPAQLLQGKVAGLSIVSPQGNPNGDYNI